MCSSDASDDATYRNTHTLTHTVSLSLSFLALYVIEHVALCLWLFSSLDLEQRDTFKTGAQPKPLPLVPTH